MPYLVDNNADLNIKIADPGKYTPNAAYVKATVDYACQAKLDSERPTAELHGGAAVPVLVTGRRTRRVTSAI